MSFQRVSKFVAAGALALSLAACSSSTSQEPAELKVLAPTGAPALATVAWQDDDNVTVDYVEGQDLLVSELSKTDGEYDVIIAPINVGVKAWQQAGAYELDGVLTWGNLYIVGDDTDWNVEGNTVAAFGETAVPGLVFNNLYPDLKANVEWYPSVAEANQALQSGSANTALLAQPVAAAAIAKGKENGKDYAVQADLQQEWQSAHETTQTGYPQAAVFVKKGVDASAAIKTLQEFTADPDTDTIKERVDAIGADVLGVPSADLAASTWSAQNIHYEPASEVKDDITEFLSVFSMELPDDIIAE